MKKIGKRLLSLGLSLVVSASIFVTAGVQAFAYTETTGTVSTDNVKVRSSASTTATQVSSLKNGDKVDIVDEATDASGYTWYKIRVNKSEYGYVRSDLVAKAGGSSSSTTTSNKTQSNQAAASLPATTATATEERVGTITENSVNVREGAGTAYNSVGKVTKGDTVTITGEATGTDNKTWYQVTFGNNKQGYIRSDLLQVGDPVAAEGSEGGEGAEGEEGSEDGEVSEGGEEGSDSQGGSAVASEAGDGNFSLVYLTDEEGSSVWYLYDNVEGYRVKVNELIDAAKSSDEVNKLVKANNNFKTILIILAIVIAALVIGLIIMALKLRDSLYYEDEEEEEYDRYSQPARRRAREDNEQEEEQRPRAARAEAQDSRKVKLAKDDEERTVRPSRPARREDAPEERPARPRRPEADYEEDRPVRRTPAERAERPARRPDADRDPATRRPSYRDADEAPRPKDEPKRRPRNFINDDDLDFEFLDLDDDK